MMKIIQKICYLLLVFFQAQTYAQKALIFGIAGQDGIYLTEFLMKKNYEVHGVLRQSAPTNLTRFRNRLDTFGLNEPTIHYGDVTDLANVLDLILEIEPDEIYNLAAQSNVKISFDTAFATAQINALGALNILESIKTSKKNIKFFQASSSEMFGKSEYDLQNERTPFRPCSPYSIAKLYAHWITINYREAYGIFASNGILFNHESPLRPETFVSKKISTAVAKIYYGLQDSIYLGNLDAKRDWGYAKDYIKAMWLILQQEHPDDFIIATGQSHSVREFVEIAFQTVGIELEWHGKDIDEKGVDKKTGKTLVAIDPKFFRPTEIRASCGDTQHTYQTLGWKAETNFQDLVKLMVTHELEALKKDEV